MLKRDIYAKLQAWKKESPKKALCIIGARQIGKTTIIEQFGREYSDRESDRVYDAENGTRKNTCLSR